MSAEVDDLKVIKTKLIKTIKMLLNEIEASEHIDDENVKAKKIDALSKAISSLVKLDALMGEEEVEEDLVKILSGTKKHMMLSIFANDITILHAHLIEATLLAEFLYNELRKAGLESLANEALKLFSVIANIRHALLQLMQSPSGEEYEY